MPCNDCFSFLKQSKTSDDKDMTEEEARDFIKQSKEYANELESWRQSVENANPTPAPLTKIRSSKVVHFRESSESVRPFI